MKRADLRKVVRWVFGPDRSGTIGVWFPQFFAIFVDDEGEGKHRTLRTYVVEAASDARCTSLC